jgi:hypothetical protein
MFQTFGNDHLNVSLNHHFESLSLLLHLPRVEALDKPLQESIGSGRVSDQQMRQIDFLGDKTKKFWREIPELSSITTSLELTRDELKGLVTILRGAGE